MIKITYIKQIKTADDIIYIDESISRVIARHHKRWQAGNHVRAASQKTQLLNLNYNKSNILSNCLYEELMKKNGFTRLSFKVN